jgi:hypothetical protein
VPGRSRLPGWHEAGHAVAAWHYRVRLLRATIVPSPEFHGHVEHVSPLRGIKLDVDDSDRARARAEKAIIMCLAGPIAQQRFSPRSWRNHHGSSDYETATDLALRLTGGGEVATAYLRYLDLATKQLVDQRWWVVELIANALLDVGQLSGSEIDQLITSGILRSLSSLRSNARHEQASPGSRVLYAAFVTR